MVSRTGLQIGGLTLLRNRNQPLGGTDYDSRNHNKQTT